MVIITTGISAVASSPFRAESTAHPSMLGIMTSSVMRSGRRSRARLTPSAPPAAVRTAYPSFSSMRLSRSRELGSSSMTSNVPRAPTVRVSSVLAAAGAGDSSGSGAGSFPSTGRRAVKVLPRPGSLSTVMSPPSRRQNLRLMARPSPVPPYLRVVEASACTNSPKSLSFCPGVMPIPLSLTAKDTRWSARRVISSLMRPFSVNLQALLRRLKRVCRNLVRSVRIVPMSSGQRSSKLFAFLATSGSIVADTSRAACAMSTGSR